MKILVFEDNLLWSSRLLQGIRGLNHEPVLLKSVPEEFQGAKAAIVNLSSPTMPIEQILPALRGTGIYIIGHAGHKENPLWEKGREAGCDTVVSNSTITHKLPDVLAMIP